MLNVSPNGSAETKTNAFRNAIKANRTIAGKIHLLKDTIRKFDGKVYNCRFDQAIKELSNDEMYFYVNSSYGHFSIIASLRNTSYSLTICNGTAANKTDEKTPQERRLFTDKKRIISDKMLESLDSRYASILKEAAEHERYINNLDAILQQVDFLKQTMSQITSPIPYDIRAAFNLNFSRY